MKIICDAMPIVYVLLVISARDDVSVSWWTGLSFLSQSDLKKYLKLCPNISGWVRQMKTQTIFALKWLGEVWAIIPFLSTGPVSMDTALLLYKIS